VGRDIRISSSDDINGRFEFGLAASLSRFHATKSANVPASHQSGTVRGFPPFAAPRRILRYGRETSKRTSEILKSAISLGLAYTSEFFVLVTNLQVIRHVRKPFKIR
jgi:hypothetical protein